jgi:tRNA threonylcarbamoyladenosine biosynthesis protein TsaB
MLDQMTITLCIETSSAHCSVALAIEETVFANTRLLKRAHNEHLLTMLDQVYRNAGISPRHTELVGFSCGPGSFTGVRIGTAVGQAVAVASNAAMAPVPSPLVWALNWHKEHEGHGAASSDDVLVSVRSRGEAYYLTHYRVNVHVLDPLHETELVSDMPDWALAASAIVGDMPPWLPHDMQSTFIADVVPHASVMVEVARSTFARGDSVAPAFGLPTYIQGDSPWRRKG